MKSFADPSSLHVGDLVAGPSTIPWLKSNIQRYPDRSATFVAALCLEARFPIYRIARIQKCDFLLWGFRYRALLTNLNDETHKISIDLNPPAINLFGPDLPDIRTEWARLVDVIDFYRNRMGYPSIAHLQSVAAD